MFYTSETHFVSVVVCEQLQHNVRNFLWMVSAHADHSTDMLNF